MNTPSGGDDRLWKFQRWTSLAMVTLFLPTGWRSPLGKTDTRQDPGGWYIELWHFEFEGSHLWIQHLWNNGTDVKKRTETKRKLEYYSASTLWRILRTLRTKVVDIYKYGKRSLTRSWSNTQLIWRRTYQPLRLLAGCRLQIKIKKVAGYWNYDSSEFASVLSGWWWWCMKFSKTEHSLAELVAKNKFKDYVDLKKRLDYVLGIRAFPRCKIRRPLKRKRLWTRTSWWRSWEYSGSRGGFNSPDIIFASWPGWRRRIQYFRNLEDHEDSSLEDYQKVSETF